MNTKVIDRHGRMKMVPPGYVLADGESVVVATAMLDAAPSMHTASKASVSMLEASRANADAVRGYADGFLQQHASREAAKRSTPAGAAHERMLDMQRNALWGDAA